MASQLNEDVLRTILQHADIATVRQLAYLSHAMLRLATPYLFRDVHITSVEQVTKLLCALQHNSSQDRQRLLYNLAHIVDLHISLSKPAATCHLVDKLSELASVASVYPFPKLRHLHISKLSMWMCTTLFNRRFWVIARAASSLNFEDFDLSTCRRASLVQRGAACPCEGAISIPMDFKTGKSTPSATHITFIAQDQIPNAQSIVDVARSCPSLQEVTFDWLPFFANEGRFRRTYGGMSTVRLPLATQIVSFLVGLYDTLHRLYEQNDTTAAVSPENAMRTVLVLPLRWNVAEASIRNAVDKLDERKGQAFELRFVWLASPVADYDEPEAQAHIYGVHWMGQA